MGGGVIQSSQPARWATFGECLYSRGYTVVPVRLIGGWGRAEYERTDDFEQVLNGGLERMGDFEQVLSQKFLGIRSLWGSAVLLRMLSFDFWTGDYCSYWGWEF